MLAPRPLLAVLAALVAALALAACGGDDEDGGEQASPPTATETQAETETQPADTAEDGDGGGDDAADEASVDMSEFAFEPTELTLSRGATIETQNVGQVQHNLTLEQPGTGRRVAGTPTIEAGEDASVEVDLEPGRYLMVCTVPGHREAGMLGELTVVR